MHCRSTPGRSTALRADWDCQHLLGPSSPQMHGPHDLACRLYDDGITFPGYAVTDTGATEAPASDASIWGKACECRGGQQTERKETGDQEFG